jgi:hypothetical protein
MAAVLGAFGWIQGREILHIALNNRFRLWSVGGREIQVKKSRTTEGERV